MKGKTGKEGISSAYGVGNDAIPVTRMALPQQEATEEQSKENDRFGTNQLGHTVDTSLKHQERMMQITTMAKIQAAMAGPASDTNIIVAISKGNITSLLDEGQDIYQPGAEEKGLDEAKASVAPHKKPKFKLKNAPLSVERGETEAVEEIQGNKQDRENLESEKRPWRKGHLHSNKKFRDKLMNYRKQYLGKTKERRTAGKLRAKGERGEVVNQLKDGRRMHCGSTVAIPVPQERETQLRRTRKTKSNAKRGKEKANRRKRQQKVPRTNRKATKIPAGIGNGENAGPTKKISTLVLRRNGAMGGTPKPENTGSDCPKKEKAWTRVRRTYM